MISLLFFNSFLFSIYLFISLPLSSVYVFSQTHCPHPLPQPPLPITSTPKTITIKNKNKPKIKSQTQIQNQTIKLIPTHHQPSSIHHKKPSNKYPPPLAHHKPYPSITKSQTHQNMPKSEPKAWERDNHRLANRRQIGKSETDRCEREIS